MAPIVLGVSLLVLFAAVSSFLIIIAGLTVTFCGFVFVVFVIIAEVA